jgi:hypothetical protein
MKIALYYSKKEATGQGFIWRRVSKALRADLSTIYW